VLKFIGAGQTAAQTEPAPALMLMQF